MSATSTLTRRVARLGPVWATLLVVLPFLVLAVVLIVHRHDYLPVGDYALTELQVRNIGQHEVLTGLYSRGVWSHPGPMYFYLIAPFYWLTGGASVGMGLAAVAINAGSIGGIALIVWRRGGTAMLLCALLGCALVMRTLGAEFLFDPWNNYVVTLPFGLLLFAIWATICGERWALLLATIVASFLAQTHVGFVLQALPLVALAAAWMVIPTLRRGSDAKQRGDALPLVRARRSRSVSVLWIPPAYDVLTNRQSNFRKIWNYFRTSDEPTHSLTAGWRIVTGQFNWPPEWLTTKRTDLVGFGESPFIGDSSLPWLLIPVVLVSFYLWRRRRDDRCGRPVHGGRPRRRDGPGNRRHHAHPRSRARLPAAIHLDAGAAGLRDHRMGGVAARRSAAGRAPQRRVLVPIAVAGIVVVSSVNLYSAATVEPLWQAESEVMAHITPPVLDAIEPGDGQVVVTDQLSDAAWYTRGLVLRLERDGVDARVLPDRGPLFGSTRVVDADEPVQATLPRRHERRRREVPQGPRLPDAHALASRTRQRVRSFDTWRATGSTGSSAPGASPPTSTPRGSRRSCPGHRKTPSPRTSPSSSTPATAPDHPTHLPFVPKPAYATGNATNGGAWASGQLAASSAWVAS